MMEYNHGGFLQVSTVFPHIVSAPLCTVNFGLMYCDLWNSKLRKGQFPRKLYEEIRYIQRVCRDVHIQKVPRSRLLQDLFAPVLLSKRLLDPQTLMSELRGHQITTWTKFCNLFHYLLSSTWTFFTLNTDKKGHFLTTYPPHLVHVVFE